MDKIIEFLKQKKINQLYVIGGDGTHRGAFMIHETCMKEVRKHKTVVRSLLKQMASQLRQPTRDC